MFLWYWTVQLFPLWLKAESDAARLSFLNQSVQNCIYKVHEIPGFREISILLTNSEVLFMFFLERVFGQIDNITSFFKQFEICSSRDNRQQASFAPAKLSVNFCCWSSRRKRSWKRSATDIDQLNFLLVFLSFLGLGLCQLDSFLWSNMIRKE